MFARIVMGPRVVQGHNSYLQIMPMIRRFSLDYNKRKLKKISLTKRSFELISFAVQIFTN